MGSPECQRATDRYNTLAGAAGLCDESKRCTLTYNDLVRVGEAYYEADAICGAGTLADAPK
jgi:hypothetical protein